MPVPAVTQPWPGSWIKPESLLTLWVRAPCYWSADITAGALGQTQRHKSNYENEPTQLSQLRTLHKASFDECLEVHTVYFPFAAEPITTKLINSRDGERGEWARAAHKGRCESHVTQTRVKSLVRSSSPQLDLLRKEPSGFKRGSCRKWEMRASFRARAFNNSDCEKDSVLPEWHTIHLVWDNNTWSWRSSAYMNSLYTVCYTGLVLQLFFFFFFLIN